MKKILLIISIFVLAMSNVKAETKDYQKEGEYLRKNLKDSRYQYEDENDVKYGPYSNYILHEDNTTLNIPYYDYEVDKVYAYHKLYNIKTIQFMTVTGPFSYQDLTIYDDETEVGYTIDDCSECLNNNTHIQDGGYLTINLKRSIESENITVKMKTTNASETPYILVRFYRDNITSNPVLKTTFYTSDNVFSFNKNWSQYQFDATKEYYSKEKIDSPLTHEEVGMKDVYRYREIFTFHYNLIAKKDQEEQDKPIEKEESLFEQNKEEPQKNNKVSPEEDLIDLKDYKYIEIPNTKKDDLFYNLFVIIRQLLSITFFS